MNKGAQNNSCIICNCMSLLSLFPSHTYHTQSGKLLMDKYLFNLLNPCYQSVFNRALPSCLKSSFQIGSQYARGKKLNSSCAIPCSPILQSLNHFSGSIFHILCQVQFHLCLRLPDPILRHPNCISVHWQGYLSLLPLAMNFFPMPQV